MKQITRRRLVLLATALPLTRAVHAQARPVRLIVPFAPGGATDIVARLLSGPLGVELGRPVVVDNVVGAGGSVGMTEVARAQSDGLTLGIATVSTHAVNPALSTKISYDPLKDFSLIAGLVKAPKVLLASPLLAANDIAGFIALAKKKPGKLLYGSAGVGSAGHMAGELLKSSTGISITHVPYQGTSQVLADLMTGGIDVAFDQLAPALPHIKLGRVKALGVCWNTRVPQLPNVQTFAEASLFTNNDPSWFGLVGPAGIPRLQIYRLNALVRKIMTRPDISAKLSDLTLVFDGSDPTEFAATIRKELDKMQRVAKIARISVNI